MKENRGVAENVASRIKCSWLKWREATGAFCRKKDALKVKWKFYEIVMRSEMTY